MATITIAIDAMGGDHGLAATIPAAIKTVKKHKNLRLILVGDQDLIKPLVSGKRHITVQHASEQVAMDELPSRALRNKKDSSMRVAINLVKEEKAQACVSSGNTGALMATARFVLKTIPGIDRPAIITTLPTYDPEKGVRMLDLGANIDSYAEHLYQFAIMGSVLAAAVDNMVAPKIGLLNIGEEEIKGNELVKQAAQLLSDSKHINYYGYVEGDDIFEGVVDVVVCNGFVGNVALKSMEGMAKLIGKAIKRVFKKSWYARLASLISLPVLLSLRKELDPGRHNGATLIGLQGIVVKSHGSADEKSFANAIEEAILEVAKNVPIRISKEVATIMGENEF